MIDLADQHLLLVKKILLNYLPSARVSVFGSRVKGTAKKFSDLDLSVNNSGPIDLKVLADLEEAFAESDLPIKVDIVDWHRISEAFQQHINEQAVILRP